MTLSLILTAFLTLPPALPMASEIWMAQAGELVDYALAGWQNNRQRLRSGLFRASGYREHKRDDGSTEREEYEVFCAFDFERRLFRFDHLGILSSTASNEETRLGGKYVYTNEYAISWIDGSQQTTIYPPEREPPATMKVFDPRLVGFVWQGIFDNRRMDYDEVVAAYRSSIRDAKKEGGSMYTLSWVTKDSKARWRLVLDAKQGFSPVRLETFGPNAARELSVLRETDMATWTEKSGVWVPTSLSMDSHRWTTRRCELAFQWEAVNKPVDESLFTWEGMQLADGTTVLDARPGGVSIVVARVGEHRDARQPPLEGSKRRWVLMVGTNVLIALLVFLIWLRRHRLRHAG